MDSNIKIYTFLALISLLFFSCEKEISTPDIPNNLISITLEQKTESAQQYARVQNYMNDFLTIAFSGAVAQPEFYGMSMAATPTLCPATELSQEGELLKLQFGEDATIEGACTTLNYARVGGTLALDKNFSSDIISTRACQPGSLEFEKLSVQGCGIEAIRSNEEVNLNPTFYALEACPNPNSTTINTDEFVSFWFEVNEKWQLQFNDPNGKSTVFNPMDNTNGPFMRIQAPNIFEGELNFEDLYDASYKISLLSQDSQFYNKASFTGAGENGEDLEFLLITTEDLVYTPYQCKNIISGQILLMDLEHKPIMNIDYGAGLEETDAGRCDNIVKICPCNEEGVVITNSADCIVTSCLPL